ncbi:MAG: dephospho-CoA kinase [Ascidiaceihabitans sp.]|jgi:dephospho-CoA kinase|nr:dephospho-CoA kinase [Ascidiaceihabitans sp.]
MFKLGLTGSIGMGKTTTASIFSALGCDVWDADAAVHRLYAKGGAAVAPMSGAFSQVIEEGAVSRAQLRSLIAADPLALKSIEKIVHPLLVQDRADFVAGSQSDILVFDIPLLFETGGDANMDGVACVWTTAEVQQERVMQRGTMSMEQFEVIRAKQLPTHEKRDRSDFVIITDTIEHARVQVQNVLTEIRQRMTNA